VWHWCVCVVELCATGVSAVLCRWEKLQKDSEAHKARLLRALEQFKKVVTPN